jgi:hypothetical protein
VLELIRPTISKFNIEDTLPELQHDFGALWNEITLSKLSTDSIAFDILRPIRHIYIALHQGTATTPTAVSPPTPDDPVVGEADETARPSTTSPLIIQSIPIQPQPPIPSQLPIRYPPPTPQQIRSLSPNP